MSRLRSVLKFAALIVLVSSQVFAQYGGELRMCLHFEPKTFDPLLSDEEASESVRYLTAGVLVRLNRATQKLEPELATAWKVSDAGRRITFTLRKGLHFSDGTPFTAEDVAFTVRRMMDPKLHSSIGDSFQSGVTGEVKVTVIAPDKVDILFPGAIVGLDALFDDVPIMSAASPNKAGAVLGPFYVADHKAGSYILLKRNTNYWKKDARGHQLPYLDAVRLDIQTNRDLEVARFTRGEVDLINTLDSELFNSISAEHASLVRDLGVSLDAEQMWFNQVPSAPIPDYKKAWFTSTAFRRAISESINRRDLARIAFSGHATPAVGPISPANKNWFNSKLQAHPYDTASARRRLSAEGFRFTGGKLFDKNGHPVEFSIATNAGNKGREKMATLIQQDLSKIGVKVNIVLLDFPSLIERFTRTYNYEAAILGFINNDLDPNGQVNLWLSSAAQHAWYPEEKSPATSWEAEIDSLVKQQAAATLPAKRKAAWDRIQQIAWEQEPLIYLVNKNAMAGIGPQVRNVAPSILRPTTYWNIEYLSLAGAGQSAAGK